METSQLFFRKKISPSRKIQIQDLHHKLNDRREKQLAKSLKPFLALRNNYKKSIKLLISAAEKKSVAQLYSDLKRTVAKTLLQNRHLPDAERLLPVRKRFKSSFLKNFSKVEQIKRLRAQYFDDIVNAAESFRTNFAINPNVLQAIIDDGIVIVSDFTRFGPPYEFGELNNTFELHTNLGDHAILDLQTGFVSIRSHYEVENTPVFDWFDAPSLLLKSFNGMGATYTLPKTGILEVVVVAQNTRSHLEASIEDNFGWSEGRVEMNAGIYLNVLHPNNIEVNELILTTLSLSTGGDDAYQKQNNLQTNSPFVVTLKSTGAFAEGETVQLLAGSVVTSLTYLDDMTANQNLLVSWQIKEMFVRVI